MDVAAASTSPAVAVAAASSTSTSTSPAAAASHLILLHFSDSLSVKYFKRNYAAAQH